MHRVSCESRSVWTRRTKQETVNSRSRPLFCSQTGGNRTYRRRTDLQGQLSHFRQKHAVSETFKRCMIVVSRDYFAVFLFVKVVVFWVENMSCGLPSLGGDSLGGEKAHFRGVVYLPFAAGGTAAGAQAPVLWATAPSR